MNAAPDTGSGPGQVSDPEAPAPHIRSPIDRQALDEVFGDLLPDTTSDERDPGSSGDLNRELWYRENRPPHHGG